MRKRLVLIGVLGIAVLGIAAAAWFWPEIRREAGYLPPTVTVSYGRLNAIPMQPPVGKVQGLAILVSGADDRDGSAGKLARDLERRDIAVLSVNLDAWRPLLDTDPGECIYLGSDLEGLSKEAQRLIDSHHYLHPVVVGVGEGATLAHAALADAPAATLAGAVSIDPAEALKTAVPVCEGAVPTAIATGGFSYALDTLLPSPGVMITANASATAQPDGGTSGGNFRLETKTAATLEDRLELGVDAIADIAAADAGSKALPVVDISPTGTPTRLALFYSGDGGWRDIDKSVGEQLAAEGIHVVGVDSLRYFWSIRQPDKVAKDMASIVREADPSGKLPVALLGYSFGADVTPFAWQYLPDDVRRRIDFIGLLGTEKTTPFQVTMENWLGLGGDRDVAPAIAALPQDRVLCVYGTDEPETACEDPSLSAIEKLKVAGDHHFDGDYKGLTAQILIAMKRREQAG
ncbi:AcvB/VirJ family lysyl-phosphatidylglycerol hydrolase [Aminobacter sp. AP02]|uniref:AcvB/VirJ family lysyl-phosphatidylglycerol hydrolase n=1 Tax=Aminobacter sp. AP02 TaxID=2135737 RepID=UPI000D7AFDA7|nr:AcvB/VirJ family lysyl-phosphatidylglycerol hydrolase [Aminobacter sp. AP02]PWK77032.1 type IV secretory pathway VirJ component [Aminobacter sp. AP02]